MPKSKSRKTTKNPRTAKMRGAMVLTATSIRRSPETFLIAAEKILKPDWMVEIDPIFENLYKKYLQGRISAYATRIPLEMIKAGFYLASRDFSYRCDRPPEDVIQGQMGDIRIGARRPLHLYKNPNQECPARFLCPDDVAIYLAYKRLDIKSVPAIVLAPGNYPLPNSAFESRVSATTTVKRVPRICGIKSAPMPSVLPSLVGRSIPKDPVEVITILNASLRHLTARLRLFHTSHPQQLHYHHTIFSAIVRSQETLEAISLLIEKNLWYQALALLRVLYELHVNFYFDWLQPETNYRYLAAATVWRTNDISRQRHAMSKELTGSGEAQSSADEQAHLAWLPVTLALNVTEKAKLPKVGIVYHRDIYDFLSQISHQTFEVASLHANRFDDETFKAIGDDAKTTYLRFMDFVMSEFINCVDSDIGSFDSPAVGLTSSSIVHAAK